MKKFLGYIFCLFAGFCFAIFLCFYIGTKQAKEREKIPNFTVVEESYANFIKVLYDRAGDRFNMNDYKGALDDLQILNSIRKNMHDVEPFKKDVEAIDCLSKIIDLTEKIQKNPKDYNLYYERALLKNKPKFSMFETELSFCSDNKGAAEDFSKVLELKPDFKEVYAKRADAIGMSMDGVRFDNDDEINMNFKRMIADYEKAIELDAATKETHLSLAGVYYGDKQYDKALQQFQELTKNDVKAYYGLAITYYAMKDYKKALQSLNTFEEKYPDICAAVNEDCPNCPCPYPAYYQLRAKIDLRLFRLKNFVKDLKSAF